MASATPRSVTPIIAKIRNLLNGRSVIPHVRHEQLQAPRSYPAPKIPKGVSHHLAANYYYTRDGRRESEPSVTPYDAQPKAISSGESSETKMPAARAPVPGHKVHNWDM